MTTDFKESISSYLTFRIGSEEFGANVSDVINIVEVQDLTHIPNAPDYLRGIISFRDKVLPVIDTRKKFGMSATEFTQKTCVIVLEFEEGGRSTHMGLLVESVEAVTEIDERSIHPSPSIGGAYSADIISGIVNQNGKFIMILDLEKIFSKREIQEINNKIE